MFSIKQVSKNIGRFVERNSTHILTGVVIGGSIGTAIFVAEATPKALKLIEEAECETNQEKIKAAWKCYIPAGISLGLTITAVISMNIISERKKAALAGLYSITQATLKEYQEKVIETIGENKEQKIRDEIDRDKVINNPPKDILITGSGDVLCLDSLSGRYFQADIEKIRKTVNDLNEHLLNEMFISLNDFYYDLGLEGIELGEELGFDIDKGLLEVRYSSQLTKEGRPCLVLNYEVSTKS